MLSRRKLSDLRPTPGNTISERRYSVTPIVINMRETAPKLNLV